MEFSCPSAGVQLGVSHVDQLGVSHVDELGVPHVDQLGGSHVDDLGGSPEGDLGLSRVELGRFMIQKSCKNDTFVIHF